MLWLVILLAAALILVILYLVILLGQIRKIDRQIEIKMKTQSHIPISLQMFNPTLNRLTSSINRCLKAEENIRLQSLRENNDFKEIIANISHDLRTPLTVIKGYQQMLQKTELTKMQQEKLEITIKYTQQIGELVEQFFAYTQAVNMEQKLTWELIDLGEFMIECLTDYVSEFQNAGRKIHVQLERAIFLKADRERLLRVLQNLIRNALEHSSGDLLIETRTFLDEILLIFSNPIEENEQIEPERLFDRFYTGDKSRRRSTGLGLSIVRLMVEQMGGSTEVAVKQGEFEIYVHFPTKMEEERT